MPTQQRSSATDLDAAGQPGVAVAHPRLRRGPAFDRARIRSASSVLLDLLLLL
jgi:hypothetical protein